VVREYNYHIAKQPESKAKHYWLSGSSFNETGSPDVD
jgi:hypothetical protein